MTGREEEARCDCGYVCRGGTDDELVVDAQRHAHEAHGIDVSREQVLTVAEPVGSERLRTGEQ